tara:strand:+ start:206 stop:442 length:237 start_codon:yes stop_codon:yes gene_type:complete
MNSRFKIGELVKILSPIEGGWEVDEGSLGIIVEASQTNKKLEVFWFSRTIPSYRKSRQIRWHRESRLVSVEKRKELLF